MRARDKARNKAIAICSEITSDIVSTVAHEESLDEVMDSFEDIFAADSPHLHLDTFFEELTTEPMDLELEELNNLSGLLQTPPSQVFVSSAALPPPPPPPALALPLTPATATPKKATTSPALTFVN